MFRSALEKTLTAAGYKVDRHTKLYDQIEAAAGDGSITDARRHRAHEEIRVLGNDVLHDVWKPLEPDEAVLARDYTQRVIEDFYDHRASVLARLHEKKGVPAEDQKKEKPSKIAAMRPANPHAAATASQCLDAVRLARDPTRLREAPDRELVTAAATCAKALVRVAEANAGMDIRERTFDLLDNAGRAIGDELRRRQ